MEQKQLLMSALGLGIGVGVGLVSEKTVSRWIGAGSADSMAELVEQELTKLVVDGKDTGVNFDEFPYYLSKKDQALLTGAAYVHLKQAEFSKFSRNISLTTNSILLSGTSELYLQMLAKALSRSFDAKVLILDVQDLSYKIQSKHGWSSNDTTRQASLLKIISEGTIERVSCFFGSLSKKWGFEHATTDIASLASSVSVKQSNSWAFDEKSLVQSLYKVMFSVLKTSPVVLFLRDVDKLMLRSERLHSMLHKMISKLSGPILILGSKIVDKNSNNNSHWINNKLSLLFAHELDITLPENDMDGPKGWKKQLAEDTKTMKLKEDMNHIAEVLAENAVDCDDLSSISLSDMENLSKHIKEIMIVAVSHHLMSDKDSKYRNGRLLISSKSLAHGLSKLHGEESKKLKPDNKFEKRLRSEAILADKIDVKFSDIGALDDVKQLLQEFALLPLCRPDLFSGGLLRPCRSILLFGPPGSGKTMLAKAIAKESGATLINLPMPITSKLFTEDEKNVKAVFSLAGKLSPAIIFIDQVDSISRTTCNEFMANWDGLAEKSGDRVLILAATNRPFDLNEAFVRKFDRRIMVGLPSLEDREKILKTLLAKDKIEGLNFKELASMTEGYCGGDLKNLCKMAAYQPVRELLQKEKEKEREKRTGKEKVKAKEEEKEKEKEPKKGDEEAEKSNMAVETESDTDKPTKEKEQEENRDKGSKDSVQLRPLTMEDMRHAMDQVSRSTPWMPDFERWNDQYGDGGLKKNNNLTYFL